MPFDSYAGANKMAKILSERMKAESKSSLILDFGKINADYSLTTNTFPVKIPKGDYSVCRQLTLGNVGSSFANTSSDGHSHSGGTHGGHQSGNGSHSHSGGGHNHSVLLPEKMRSIKPGDRVLVAWVQSEAVVIDIVMNL